MLSSTKDEIITTTGKILEGLQKIQPFKIFEDYENPSENPIKAKKSEPDDQPVRSLPKSIFQFDLRSSNSLSKSFHVVDKVKKKKKNGQVKDIIYYFKNNPANSYMSELEAVCWSFYELLIPDNVPESVHPVYAEGYKYVGVCSQGLPAFKSIVEEPLTEDDLHIECLENGSLTVPELEIINDHAEELNLNLENLQENIFFNVNDKTVNIKTLTTDLIKFRTLTDLAAILVASWFLEEDDLHPGNYSRRRRYDFDMSLWSILCNFKESKFYVDGISRMPNDDAFIIHEEDIIEFPDLRHAKPYYWPTFAKPWHSNYIPSSNSFTAEDIRVHKLLKIHEVFKRSQYRTLLKISLLEGDMYHSVASLSMRDHLMLNKKRILDIKTSHMSARTKILRETLINIPYFQDFLAENANYSFKRILDAFEKRNKKTLAKIEKLQNKIADSEQDDSLDFDTDICTNQLKRKVEAYRDILIDKNIIKKNFKMMLSATQEARIKAKAKAEQEEIMEFPPDMSALLQQPKIQKPY